MDLIFFALMLLSIYIIVMTVAPDQSKVSNDRVIKVVKEKFCPPHQWSWVDMVDQDGKKVGEKMVCKLCGPLQSQSGRD